MVYGLKTPQFIAGLATKKGDLAAKNHRFSYKIAGLATKRLAYSFQVSLPEGNSEQMVSHQKWFIHVLIDSQYIPTPVNQLRSRVLVVDWSHGWVMLSDKSRPVQHFTKSPVTRADCLGFFMVNGPTKNEGLFSQIWHSLQNRIHHQEQVIPIDCAKRGWSWQVSWWWIDGQWPLVISMSIAWWWLVTVDWRLVFDCL